MDLYPTLEAVQLLSPALCTFVFGLALMVLPFMDVFDSERPRRELLSMSLIGLAIATLLNLYVAGMVTTPTLAFSSAVTIDHYGVFFNFVVLLACAGALLIGYDYLEEIGVSVPEYYALVMFSAFGMMMVAAANEMVLLFIAIEVMSIALYVLCGINRGELRSVESAFKYFILGAFSSAILLYGIAMVYGVVGSTKITALASFLSHGSALGDTPLLSVGIALMLVGLGFKVAAVPFHAWSPDVYQGAPTPITALMATGIKAASFAAFGRIVFEALRIAHDDVTWALWAMAALTILVGNIGALVQDDLKRMLAYSSIGHAGYLLMALVAVPAAGVAANPRTSGLLFYLFAYTVMTIGAFAVVALMTRDGAEDTRIDRLAGLASSRPGLALGLTVCLVSLAGIPPTVGFVGKFYLFAAAVEGGFPGLAVVGAIGGAIGVYYYLRPIVVMYMRPTVDDWVPAESGTAVISLGVAVVLILFFGLFPNPLVDLARDAIMSLAHDSAPLLAHQP